MRALLLGFILLCSGILHAAPDDTNVTQWTKKTLTNTLAVSYKYEDDVEQYKVGFTPLAWDAISDFLGGYLPIIKERQLTIHPLFLIKPAVVDSGVASGIKFWRVNTEVLLPELKAKIAFSLIIIATTPSATGAYLIQSLSMQKQENQ